MNRYADGLKASKEVFIVTIKEAEQITGITSQNIRYYEKQ